MYLPSVNELNKNALSQKVVDENDERVRKTVMKPATVPPGTIPGEIGYSPSMNVGKGPNRFSVNPQDMQDAQQAFGNRR